SEALPAPTPVDTSPRPVGAGPSTPSFDGGRATAPFPDDPLMVPPREPAPVPRVVPDGPPASSVPAPPSHPAPVARETYPLTIARRARTDAEPGPGLTAVPHASRKNGLRPVVLQVPTPSPETHQRSAAGALTAAPSPAPTAPPSQEP